MQIKHNSGLEFYKNVIVLVIVHPIQKLSWTHFQESRRITTIFSSTIFIFSRQEII